MGGEGETGKARGRRRLFSLGEEHLSGECPRCACTIYGSGENLNCPESFGKQASQAGRSEAPC